MFVTFAPRFFCCRFEGCHTLRVVVNPFEALLIKFDVSDKCDHLRIPFKKLKKEAYGYSGFGNPAFILA